MQSNKQEDAFTLLEVVITTFVVLVFFLPLASKMTGEVQTISQSKQKTQAIALARQVINQIKEKAKQEYDDAVAFESNLRGLFNSDDYAWQGFQRNSSGLRIWNQIAPPNNFSSNLNYTVKVNFKDRSGSKDIKKVTVRVEWPIKEEGALVTRHEDLVTLITRR